MTTREHADHTENLFGIRAEDVHKWIDGLFDVEGFTSFLKYGRTPDYNPYDHRKHRHCREAIENAYLEFKGKYTEEQIKNIFETHIKDDYQGVIPFRADFSDPGFTKKYHETENIKKESILSDIELSDYFKGNSYQAFKKSTARKLRGFHLRIILPSIVSILLFIFSLFFLIVPLFYEVMLEGKKEMTRELSSAAASIIYYYIDLDKQNLLSREEAQLETIKEIEKIRYGTEHKDYFWITDMYPKMIMHPYRQELIGQDLTNYRDSEDKSGKNIFIEFVELVKMNNEGYLEYLWQWMDDKGTAVPKLSYVIGIPEWSWILGTGLYIQDIKDETGRFTGNLVLMCITISGLLFVLLLYLVSQSRRSENKRSKAETGLREAKERYRALVEASNEGYILEMNGSIVYSNIALQRMLDYSEEELAALPLLSILTENVSVNEFAVGHLESLLHDQVHSANFEAEIQTRNNHKIDMVVTTSRIFFSEKNGHLISFRKIMPLKDTESFSEINYSESERYIQLELAEKIGKSRTVGHVIQLLNQVPYQIKKLTEKGTLPSILRNTIGEIYDAAAIRFIEISIKELGDPPVKYAFLNLGSNARHEMTFFSDQDNALVFKTDDNSNLKEIKHYFLNLTEKVSYMLHQGGFSFCPGGIMASNPQWCLSENEWKERIHNWVSNINPDSILKINVFSDIRHLYGDLQLTESIQAILFKKSKEHTSFLLFFARNYLSYRLPLGLLGKLKGELIDGVPSINVKQVLKIIENFCRLYSLKHCIKSATTESRIKELIRLKVLSPESSKELLFIFDYLWNLRFYNQLKTHSDLLHVNDEIEINILSEIEQKNLQNVLSQIQIYQSRISFDFLGTPL